MTKEKNMERVVNMNENYIRDIKAITGLLLGMDNDTELDYEVKESQYSIFRFNDVFYVLEYPLEITEGWSSVDLISYRLQDIHRLVSTLIEEKY